MKSISYLPGLSFTHNFYINEIKDLYRYNIYSSSPKSKFTINKNGNYYFTPMPLKILSRLTNNYYPNFFKSIDMSIYNNLISMILKKTDILHCNSCFAHAAFFSKISDKVFKIVEEQNSHIKYCNDILNREFSKFNIKLQFDKKAIQKRIDEYDKADIILVPSDYSLKSFEMMGIERKKLFKNMLINSKYLKNQKKTNKITDKIIYGYIGGNVITKGLIYLLESLSKKNQNYELHMTLTQKNFLKFNFLKKYLNKNIKFLGNFSNMDNFYKKIDVLVVPSINDGFCMVVIEALSRSIPVIVSNNVGASEYITSEFGYKFESGNQEQLDYLINKKISPQEILDLNDSIYKNFFKIKNVFSLSSKKLLNLYSY